MPALEAAPRGDVFITVTGVPDVLRGEHFAVMKDGAVLANAGQFDVEISLADLRAAASDVREILPLVERFELGDRALHLLAGGRVVNLAAAEGHPAAVMDVSFALQALAAEALVRGYVDARRAPGAGRDRARGRGAEAGRAARRHRLADRRAGGLPVAHIATARPLTRISGRRVVDLDRQQARAAHVDALVDGDRRGRRDEALVSQVGAERGGRRAGRGVLDDAADRERVARVEGVLVLAVDEVDRRQVVGEHQLLERVEVVVEVGEALARARR